MTDRHLPSVGDQRSIKRAMVDALTGFGVEYVEALVESEMLVEHVTGMNPSRQLVCSDIKMSKEQIDLLESAMVERSQRVPVQYIIGSARFRGLDFRVGPGVFIPRCDTETLIEVFLNSVDTPVGRFLEVGAGSGAISITLLTCMAASRMVATEVSDAAVVASRQNAFRHKVANRMKVVQTAEWWEMGERFDGIISNPPYIPLSQAAGLQPEVGLHEPYEALFGTDEDGLGFYRKLAATGQWLLKSLRAILAVEVGDGQAPLVASIFEEEDWRHIEIHKDANGLERVITARIRHISLVK